ncbi:MAG: LysR family transcriptional regulator [Cyanobacteria bacterium K_Offshore_surface_m2_239]|nr:LysR family transcriptional regulator [Cyanobacteria bacterium K_Offshore_surface_m2_239]
MVIPSRLEAFDVLLWVCNGQHAGQVTALSQPTISRAAHQTSECLGISLRKIRGEWHVNGDTLRLNEERQLHQAARLAGQGPTRLEAGALSSHMLADPAPRGWVLGRADAINQPRSLALLRDRVIDAWLCTSAIDLPAEVHANLSVFELYRAPLRLVASTDHPLTGERGLNSSDLSPFPSVALDGDWYPTSAARLREHGLWSSPRPLTHHRSQHWEGRTADGHTLAYASPLTLARQPGLAPLDFDLGLDHVLALVVLRDWANHARIQELLENLCLRLAGQPDATLRPDWGVPMVARPSGNGYESAA